MMPQRFAFAVVLSLWMAAAENIAKLRLVHFGDVHGAVEPVTYEGEPCPNREDQASVECFGGLAKIRGMVDLVTSKAPDRTVIVLSTGDWFSGTVWDTHFRGSEMSKLMPMLKIDAAVPGDQDFHFGSEGFASLAKSSDVFTACNINATDDSVLNEVNIPSYRLVQDKGVKIAIIGIVNKKSKFFSNPGEHVFFLDERNHIEECLRQAATAGADVTIVLSHAGLEVDKQLASLPLVNQTAAIVGGHSHVKLGNITGAVGPYPLLIANGAKQIPVVNAWQKTVYAGLLDIDFDIDAKKVLLAKGEPCLLSDHMLSMNYIPDNAFVGRAILDLRADLEESLREVVGTSESTIPLTVASESAIGNLVAEAVRVGAGTNVSFVPSRLIKRGLPFGDITLGDIYNVVPGDITVDVKEIPGDRLVLLLEEALADAATPGEFLQFSGLRVIYDSKRKSSERLIQVQLDGKDSKIQIDQQYSIAITRDMHQGPGAYEALEFSSKASFNEGRLPSFLRSHIKTSSPIAGGRDGRYHDVSNPISTPAPTTTPGDSTSLSVFATSALMAAVAAF